MCINAAVIYYFKTCFAASGFSNKTCFKKCFQHPVFQDLGLWLMFAIFNVILPSSDFVSDILTSHRHIVTSSHRHILTSQTFFARKHYYWGFCTLFFVFLPLLGKLLMFISTIVMCFLRKVDTRYYSNKMTKFKVLCKGSPELIWHIPPLIIVRLVAKIFF